MTVSEGQNAGILAQVALACGSTEPALKLLLSILLGYPLAFFFRSTIYGKSSTLQHLYFALCGIALCYFNYGFDVIHSLGSVFVVYLLLSFQAGTRLSVLIAYIYFMSYLLIGYYMTATEEYDIMWTMPHCVLTLRVIGLVVDVYDGKKEKDRVSSNQKEIALNTVPSFLEIAGFVYFFGGFMAGPQFPMKRYLKFTSGELIPSKGLPNSVRSGLTRGATSIGYLALYLIANHFFPIDYLFTDDYKSRSLLMRHILLGCCGKLLFCKYIICWMMAEGSCTVLGITYNEKDENGRGHWDACANVHLRQFETATQFNECIQSFNILTNKWVAHYIYKRLKFFNNKLISQLFTLIFLALWHGLHIGYYLCFALEFGVMKLESDIERMIAKRPSIVSFLNHPIVKPAKLLLLRIYIVVFLSYCMIPLSIVNWSKANEIFTEVYYSGHILYFGWLVIYPLAKTLLRLKNSTATKDRTKKD